MWYCITLIIQLPLKKSPNMSLAKIILQTPVKVVFLQYRYKPVAAGFSEVLSEEQPGLQELGNYSVLCTVKLKADIFALVQPSPTSRPM